MRSNTTGRNPGNKVQGATLKVYMLSRGHSFKLLGMQSRDTACLAAVFGPSALLKVFASEMAVELHTKVSTAFHRALTVNVCFVPPNDVQGWLSPTPGTANQGAMGGAAWGLSPIRSHPIHCTGPPFLAKP